MDSLIKNIERVTGSVGILASFALVPLVLATCYPFNAITHGPLRYLVKAEMINLH